MLDAHSDRAIGGTVPDLLRGERPRMPAVLSTHGTTIDRTAWHEDGADLLGRSSLPLGRDLTQVDRDARA